jgi:hypothetical protein
MIPPRAPCPGAPAPRQAVIADGGDGGARFASPRRLIETSRKIFSERGNVFSERGFALGELRLGSKSETRGAEMLDKALGDDLRHYLGGR